MPISKNEHLEIQAMIDQSMSAGTIDEVIEEAKNLLRTHMVYIDSGLAPTCSDKEFETAIEILVKYEAAKNNLGSFKRAKLRSELVLKYSSSS